MKEMHRAVINLLKEKYPGMAAVSAIMYELAILNGRLNSHELSQAVNLGVLERVSLLNEVLAEIRIAKGAIKCAVIYEQELVDCWIAMDEGEDINEFGFEPAWLVGSGRFITGGTGYVTGWGNEQGWDFIPEGFIKPGEKKTH